MRHVSSRSSVATLRTAVHLLLTYLLTYLLLHPCNDLFSRTTWLSRCQKAKTSLDLNEARDDGVLGCSAWHQLDHMQTICTSLQTDNPLADLGFLEGVTLGTRTSEATEH